MAYLVLVADGHGPDLRLQGLHLAVHADNQTETHPP